MRRVYVAHATKVLYNRPDRGPPQFIERVFVDFREVAERDLGCRQVSGQPYQAVNVPRIYPALARPGVLLLPHRPGLV